MRIKSLLPVFALCAPSVLLNGCATIGERFENTTHILSGHEQCVQAYIDRARALQEEITGETSTIDDATDAASYAMGVINLSSRLLYSFFFSATKEQIQEARDINNGLWISKRHPYGVPGIGTETYTHCR